MIKKNWNEFYMANKRKSKEIDGFYYTYIFLNPLKPANIYFEEVNITLLYEPFYIGKGSSNRVKTHFYPSSLKNKSIKNNIIKKIHKNNKHVITLKLDVNLTQLKALELEEKYIKKFGRINNKTGILSNLTDGGDGTANLIILKTRKMVDKICTKTLEIIETYDSVSIAAKKK